MLVHNDMMALGKGKGVKSTDLGAAGCDACHRALAGLPREEQHYYTMRGTIRTMSAFLERGWFGPKISLIQIQREILAS